MSTLQPIKMMFLEVRIGGRFGPVPRSGRRGVPLFQLKVPETLRDYLPDLIEHALPEAIGAVHIFADDESEPLRSWSSKTHDASLVRQVEVGDLDGQATSLRAEVRGLEQQRDLLQRALELTQAQIQHAAATRDGEVEALARERARIGERMAELAALEGKERVRVQATLEQLDAWAQQRQALAMSDVQRLSSVCEAVREQVTAAVVQVGQVGAGVMEREGAVARLSATNQAEIQSGALASVQLFGDLLGQLRASTALALSTTPNGPSPADKLVDVAKGVVFGPLGQALAHRLGGEGFKPTAPDPTAPASAPTPPASEG